jgi:3-hydroxyacyl-CoA dehydrogenase
MKVAVIGAGVMGHGIAEVFSIYGNQVFLYDKFEEALKKGLEKIKWSLDKLYEKGKISEKPEEVMGRITPIKELKEVKGSEIVIEAVPENFNLKAEVFKEVEKYVDGNTIIATNTSSLPITELSQALLKRDRFLGLHFFNPPVLMGLVEVIRGEYTSDEVFAKGIEIVRSISREPIPVRKDVIGFVVNRILFRIFTTACRLTNKYTIEQIDSTAKHILKFPMGIFELLDFTGIDTNYLISKEVMKRGFDFTCPQLEELYKKGYYGSKSGKGFYDWSKGRPDIKFLPGPTPQELLVDAVKEGRWLVENGVSTDEEVNKATRLGLGWPKGLFDYAKEYGL